MGNIVNIPIVGTSLPSSNVLINNGLTTLDNSKIGGYGSVVSTMKAGRVINDDCCFMSLTVASVALAVYPNYTVIHDNLSAIYNVDGISIYYVKRYGGWNVIPNEETFHNQDEMFHSFLGSFSYPITYRLTNCTAPSAPTGAAIGDTVTVPFQFTSGYGIVNPSSDVYVTNNGVVVPSQYSNGVLTFTMPDPS